MRINYRGHWISDVVSEGLPKVIVRPEGQRTVEWRLLGTGDHQVGRDYVDEKLDGKKPAGHGAGLEALLDVMVGEKDKEIAALGDRVLELEEMLRTVQTDADVRKSQLLGMFLLDGNPNREQVKKAARMQYKRWHPDHGGDAGVFQRLKAAEAELLKLC